MEYDQKFPRTTRDNHRTTSPSTNDYNCVAWAAGDSERWWQPTVYWPIGAEPEDYGIAALVGAFRSLG